MTKAFMKMVELKKLEQSDRVQLIADNQEVSNYGVPSVGLAVINKNQ